MLPRSRRRSRPLSTSPRAQRLAGRRRQARPHPDQPRDRGEHARERDASGATRVRRTRGAGARSRALAVARLLMPSRSLRSAAAARARAARAWPARRCASCRRTTHVDVAGPHVGNELDGGPPVTAGRAQLGAMADHVDDPEAGAARGGRARPAGRGRARARRGTAARRRDDGACPAQSRAPRPAHGWVRCRNPRRSAAAVTDALAQREVPEGSLRDHRCARAQVGEGRAVVAGVLDRDPQPSVVGAAESE